MKLLSLLFLAGASRAFAGCPGKCSGHGTCGLGDTCKCQPMWVGPDCGSRQCPFGVSWTTSSITNDAPSGTIGILAEGTLGVDMVAGKTSTVLEPRHNCGANDCWKGKSIQYMSSDNAVVSATDAGAKWGAPLTITASATGANTVTHGDAGFVYLAGNKYRIVGSGGMTGRHEYSECSSKGICDRSSGECACFDGYEGRGCRRQTCPNSCSGHGRCVYNNQVNPLYGPTVTIPNEFISQYWDYKKTRQCQCDRGWEGYDCGSRICPKGDDPLTDCDNVAVRTEISDIQELDFATFTAAGWSTLTFTDMFNGNYTTKPFELPMMSATTGLTVANGVAAKIEEALEELPNFAAPNVTVTSDCGATENDCNTNGHKYLVTFVDEANAGPQDLLVCSDSTNAQTRYNNPNTQPRFKEPQSAANKDGRACTVKRVTLDKFTAAAGFGEKEHSECSNRGVCDTSTGVCSCFEGFSGEACATQTVFF